MFCKNHSFQKFEHGYIFKHLYFHVQITYKVNICITPLDSLVRVLISTHSSVAVDRGVDPCSRQTKDYNEMCICFYPKHS